MQRPQLRHFIKDFGCAFEDVLCGEVDELKEAVCSEAGCVGVETIVIL